MKKFFALTILAAAFAGSAIADSSVAVGVSSGSFVYGTNQSASHFATASATNSTSTGGFVTGNNFIGGGVTNAETKGSTSTTAGGYGLGGASANANQAGVASITLVAPKMVVSSTAATDTGSVAKVYNTGFATSGSQGSAENTTAAGYVKLPFIGTIVTGTSTGSDKVKTSGWATWGDYKNAGGFAGQSGGAVASH